MPSPAQTHLTVDEYLAIERQATSKSEYFRGVMFAMSGASRRRNLITVNLAAGLHTRLQQRRCEVYHSDMRVKVNSTGLYTYPDIVVVCEEPLFEDAEVDMLLNPTVLIEVLSKSTADDDRDEKFEHYRTLPSLQEYRLVAQGQCHVVHSIRQPDNTWLLTETYNLQDRLSLPSILCDLLLSEVYAKVLLEP